MASTMRGLRTLAVEYAWPGYRPVEKEIRPLDAVVMEDFAGDYIVGGNIVLKIYVEGDHLRRKPYCLCV